MKLLYFLFVAVFLIRNVKLTSNFLEGYNFDHVPAKLIQTYFENWNKWKSYYNKIYDNHLEESKEFYNWVLNTVKVFKHNELYEAGVSSYQLGVNEFTSTDPDVFLAQMFDKSRPKMMQSPRNSTKYLDQFKAGIPKHVDWRDKKLVTSVKHQGRCATGWAFAAAGAAETLYNKFEGGGVSFSAQQLVDCVRSSRGCSGGSAIDGIFYFNFLYGVSEEDYPYSGDKGICSYDDVDHLTASQVPYVWYLPKGDESSLKIAVAEFGPVAVTFKVTDYFQFYKSGVFNDHKCSTDDTSYHSGLIVGYGTDASDGDYWIVKNSFGENWGEKGYIKMARNKDNFCGIASSAFLALPIPLF